MKNTVCATTLFKRFYLVADIEEGNILGLANFLGVRQSEVARAQREGRIPEGWLFKAMAKKDVCPCWIMTGESRCSAECCPAMDRDVHNPYDLENVPLDDILSELARRARK